MYSTYTSTGKTAKKHFSFILSARRLIKKQTRSLHDELEEKEEQACITQVLFAAPLLCLRIRVADFAGV